MPRALVVGRHEDAHAGREAGARQRVHVVDARALAGAAGSPRARRACRPHVHRVHEERGRPRTRGRTREATVSSVTRRLRLERVSRDRGRDRSGRARRRAVRKRSSAGVEDPLELAEVVVADELVDVPDVLEDESGAASQRVVVALERRGDARRSTSRPAATSPSRAASRTHHDRSARSGTRKGAAVRRRDRRRGAARLRAHQRIRVVEQAERAAQRLSRGGRPKRLERGRRGRSATGPRSSQGRGARRATA